MSTTNEANLPPANYDEAQVPTYTLPAVLPRQQALPLFATHVYGEEPPAPDTTTVLQHREDRFFHELTIECRRAQQSIQFHVLICCPRSKQPLPCAVGMNFLGNHTTTPGSFVSLTKNWMPDRPSEGLFGHQANQASRGFKSYRWPFVENMLAGWATATIYSGDLAPDNPEIWQSKAAQLYPELLEGDARPGAISWWAWGLSRFYDVLPQLNLPLDPDAIITAGHSRMGKTALLAAARDERFAGAFVNNSGSTGTAISRRCFGERPIHMNTRFPHWCTPNYRQWHEREDRLPIDQHQLVACIAPRMCYISSAQQDTWADPRGEFLGGLAAESAFTAAGWPGLTTDYQPDLGLSTGTGIGYHVRAGGHDITATDWYLAHQFFKRSWAHQANRG